MRTKVRIIVFGMGLERRSDGERARESTSRGRENLRATASKLFVTAEHPGHKR